MRVGGAGHPTTGGDIRVSEAGAGEERIVRALAERDVDRLVGYRQRWSVRMVLAVALNPRTVPTLL